MSVNVVSSGGQNWLRLRAVLSESSRADVQRERVLASAFWAPRRASATCEVVALSSVTPRVQTSTGLERTASRRAAR